METTKRSDSARIFPFNSWRDITPLQASLGTMLHNKTGSWRFIKPIYEEKVPGCQMAALRKRYRRVDQADQSKRV